MARREDDNLFEHDASAWQQRALVAVFGATVVGVLVYRALAWAAPEQLDHAMNSLVELVGSLTACGLC